MDSMRRKLISMLTPKERSISGNAPLSFRATTGNIMSLKQYGKCEQRNLPVGFTQLQYIESDGTQVIDIDISGDATFIGTAQSTTDSPTTSQVLIANSGASSGHWFGVQSPNAGSSFAKRWGLGAINTASTTIYGTTKVDFEIIFTQSSQYGTVNDQVLKRESSTSAHTNWVAFAGGTTPLYGFIGKVWGLKVVQNDVLVRNLIPAKNSSNVVGMYDLVSGRFFRSSTASNFVAGLEAVPTPDAPMDIVSNNGVLKINSQGQIYTDGTVETIEDTIGNTATAEMLLKVGDYQDVQEILSGAVTRKVRVKVLDGTENWVESGNLFYAAIATDALEDTHSCYCTHFKGVTTNASAGYNNEIKVGTNSTQTINWTRIQIYPVVGTYSNVTVLKQWLADQYAAGTPVIVVYPLDEPTTESVSPQSLRTRSGNNTIDVDSNVDPVEIEVKYKG